MPYSTGPWRVDETHDAGRLLTVIRDARGVVLARLVRHGLPSDGANAALLAAGPSLLGACREALEALASLTARRGCLNPSDPDHDDHPCTPCRLVAAIKAATSGDR